MKRSTIILIIFLVLLIITPIVIVKTVNNADERLTPIGRRIGLVSDAQDTAVQEKYRMVAQEIKRLEATGVAESEALNEMLRAHDTAPVEGSARLADLVRRPQLSYDDLAPFDPERPELPPEIGRASCRERV